MNVLVIGGGGREHAICWKLRQSPLVKKLFAVPGNAGMDSFCTCDGSISASDSQKILKYIEENDIGYTVVAPDNPLADGLVDILSANGHMAFGPVAKAAMIESSKVFSKQLMQKYNIPTAQYREFSNYAAAKEYIDTLTKFPVVVKADGLAYGKGVIICDSKESAVNAASSIMLDKKFGFAGERLIVEEFLTGREVTVLCFTDGKTIIPMESSQDHKRALNDDGGENTGGMGTFSPSGFYTKELADRVYDEILVPTMHAMNTEGRTFKGVLYVGLMIDGDDIRVLEYNARFGDPETQVILPRLKNDLMEVFLAVSGEKLHEVELEWDSRACVCVVAASGGYPGPYGTGIAINIGDIDDDVMIFHSGTAKDGTGGLITAGGRVLGVSALGADIDAARDKVYKNMESISFAGMHYRTDIGIKR